MPTENKDIMIIQAGCGYCEEAEELLKGRIEDEQLEVIPIESPYGAHLAKKYDIDSTPTVMHIEKGVMQKCFIDFEKKVMECEDGTIIKLDDEE